MTPVVTTVVLRKRFQLQLPIVSKTSRSAQHVDRSCFAHSQIVKSVDPNARWSTCCRPIYGVRVYNAVNKICVCRVCLSSVFELIMIVAVLMSRHTDSR